jgi:arylsulfatase A-like enzyme
MNRRSFLKALSLAAASIALPGCTRTAMQLTADHKPNFVFFLIDDLGWMDLGCYGSKFYETPNIDKLAAESVRFTNAYAACPVCSPTRASIMTGKYPARIDLTNFIAGDRKGKLIGADYYHYMKREETTIAEALKEADYSTCFVGKWHLGGKEYYPEKQGFDLNIAGYHAGHPPTYFYPYKKPDSQWNPAIENLEGGKKGEYLTDRLTDESIKFLDKTTGRPFLLYLSHYAVHTPLEAKKSLTARYQAKADALPDIEPKFMVAENQAYSAFGKKIKIRMVQDHATYAAMIQSVDESVGKVVKKLKDLHAYDNTVIIFMSDNGGLCSSNEGAPTSNLPLRAGKGWLYEGGIREPMLIRWPGVTIGGSTCDEPVISTDFYPTMLEMADLPSRPEQHRDGVSLVPLLKAYPLRPRPLFWHYPHYGNQGGRPGGAVRLGDYKLLEWYDDFSVELYNLADDISERDNLAEDLPDKVDELRTLLHNWRITVDAKMPKPNPDYKPKIDKQAEQAV